MNEPVHDADNWDGRERREIPFHIISHVEGRLTQHIDKVESLVENHTREEMERYQEIIDRIDQNRHESEERHRILSDSLRVFMDKTSDFHEHVAQAFPKDPQTNAPDFTGHAKAHRSWIENSSADRELMEYVKQQMQEDIKTKDDFRFYKRAVIAALCVAFAGWSLTLLWKGAAQGPQQPAVEIHK